MKLSPHVSRLGQIYLKACLLAHVKPIPPLMSMLMNRNSEDIFIIDFSSFSKICLGHYHCTTIAKLLPHLKQLHTLSFHQQRIGDAGLSVLVDAISTSSITSLDLSSCELSIRSYKAIGSILTSSGNSGPTETPETGEDGTAAASSTSQRHIQQLNLSNNNFSHSVAGKIIRIAAASGVQELLMNSIGTKSTPVWGELGEALASPSCRLERVELARNGMTVTKSSIPDWTLFCQSLAANTTLRALDLSANSIGTKAAATLRDSLLPNRLLTMLNLALNPIGPTMLQDITDAVQHNQTGYLDGLRASLSSPSLARIHSHVTPRFGDAAIASGDHRNSSARGLLPALHETRTDALRASQALDVSIPGAGKRVSSCLAAAERRLASLLAAAEREEGAADAADALAVTASNSAQEPIGAESLATAATSAAALSNRVAEASRENSSLRMRVSQVQTGLGSAGCIGEDLEDELSRLHESRSQLEQVVIEQRTAVRDLQRRLEQETRRLEGVSPVSASPGVRMSPIPIAASRLEPAGSSSRVKDL
eukprot:gnl/Dysnectes_brevis/856_a948_1381.p1 GENE.gnl/Dysnectes_brevis/856_a948_1381~~gnl/Dysnectes_brevis/856_a948_1381.p1  ORF type:complete len:538 (+),score=141.82 gnl/Dysnectes_brevis/856_a948_1381:951-2564(+)